VCWFYEKEDNAKKVFVCFVSMMDGSVLRKDACVEIDFVRGGRK